MMADLFSRRSATSFQRVMVFAVAFGAVLHFVSAAEAAIQHQYTFNGATVDDIVGTADGTLQSGATVAGGVLSLAGGANGQAAPHAALPGDTIGLYNYTAVTMSLWTTNTGVPTDWQRYYDIGHQNGGADAGGPGYLFLTPNAGGGNNLRMALNNGGEQQLNSNNAIVPAGQRHNVIFTFDTATNLGRMYQDGVLVAQNSNMTNTLAALDFIPAMVGDPDRPNLFFLGASLFNNDPGYAGDITQFEIYDTALPIADVLTTFAAGPVGEAAPAPPAGITELTIDRDTGAMTINQRGSAAQVIGYSIDSNNGGLNSAGWISIASNYDAGDGGEVDGNDNWTELSDPASKTDFSEFSFDVLGDGASFGATPIAIGAAGAWRKSIYEDVDMTLALADGSLVDAAVTFVGNGGSAFARSDLDFNGDINTADWQIFLASAGTTFVDMTDAETYAFGDLNGDGVSNVADFRLFKADYLAANPPGSGAVSFDELAGAVPEPATLTLFAMSLAGVALWPRQRRRTRPVVATRPRVLSRRRMPAGLAFCLLAVVVVASMQSNADAVLRHRYNFNTDVAALGMFEDLVGNADGTLFGAATVAGGQLVLPGGGAAKAGDHAQLLANGANGININTYTNASFESWVTVNDEAELWARIFDFGGHSISAPTNAGNSIFMTQNAGGANDVRFAISNVDINTQSGFQGEQTANTNTNLVNGAETHLVGVFNGDANVMQLYVNGALVGTNNNATFQLELLQTDFALLGAALYNDPSLNGSINDFRVYDHALTTSDIGKNSILGPERTGEILKLVVNTTGAGSVTVVNEQGDLPIDIDYYKISSAMGALNPGGWMSFDDGESDAPGLGWDEGASNVNALQEFVLGGGSAGETFAAGGMTSLGNAFNTSTFGAGNPGDLMFEYGGPSGFLIQGAVEYVTTPAVLGDYNGDGTVNAADYTVYRNRKAGIGGTTLMNEGPGITPGVVTVEDYNYWKSRYGATSGSGATVGGGDVPEPATLVSLVLGGLLMFGCSIGRRRVR